MAAKEGLLIVTCESCHNPAIIPPELELKLFEKDTLVCPQCEHHNEITDELRVYAVTSWLELVNRV